MKDDAGQTADKVVKVRLFVEGRVVEFDLPGPLVAMPKKGRKGDGR